MRTIATFDPSVTNSGEIVTQTVNPCSVVVLFNHSLNGLTLTMPNGDTANLPPWYFRYYYMAMPGNIQWATNFQLTSSGPPVSKVTGEVYEPSEAEQRTFAEGPLPLSMNVGNVVQTAMGGSTSLQNDGNIASTVWLEATQSGGPASNVSGTVDGSIQFNQWDGTTKKLLFQIIANAAANNPSIKMLTAGLIAEVLGTLLVDNNQALQWKRTDGVASTILQVNNFDQTQIFGASKSVGDGDVLQILKHDGTIMAIFDLVNGLLNMTGTKQTVNGDTSGTMDVYEVFSGAIKIVMAVQTNYKHAGAAQFVTLKTAFTNTCGVLNFGAGPVNVATGGVAASGREVTWGTGTAAGSQNSTSQANQDAAWFPVGGSGFTQVGSTGGYAAAFNGIVFYLGL